MTVAAAAVSLAMATATSGPDSTMVVVSSPLPGRMARWRVLVAALVAADLGIPFLESSQDACGGRSFLRHQRRWMLDRDGFYYCMDNDSGWRDGGCSLQCPELGRRPLSINGGGLRVVRATWSLDLETAAWRYGTSPPSTDRVRCGSAGDTRASLGVVGQYLSSTGEATGECATGGCTHDILCGDIKSCLPSAGDAQWLSWRRWHV